MNAPPPVPALTQNRKPLYKELKNSWLLLPAILFYTKVFQCLENIPTMDDYDIILQFLLKYTSSDFSTKCGMIFGQYGEHRLVPSKLLYIGYYYLTGGVNFRVIGLIGDAQLLVVALVSIHFIRKYLATGWELVAFIWMLCLFDLNTYENACMTMNAVGNYGVVMLFFVSLYFYSRPAKYLPVAIVFQALCIFSNGNGLAAGVFLVLFNLSAGDRIQQISSAATSIVFTSLYFIDYKTVELPNKLPFDIGRLLAYFIQMAGAPFNFNNSLGWGLVVLGGLAYVLPYRLLRDKKLAPLLCIWIFALSTMGLAAVFRSGYKGAQFQTSRYLIYPQLLIATLVLFTYMKIKNTSWKLAGSILIGIVLWGAYARNYYFGAGGFARTQFRALNMRYWHPEPRKADSICKAACAKDMYCIEDHR